MTAEAVATAAQTLALARALGANAFVSLARSGVWGSMSLNERVTLADEVAAALALSGVSKDEVAKLWKPLDYLVRRQLTTRIETLAVPEFKDNTERMSKFYGDFGKLFDHSSKFVAPPSQFRRLLEAHELHGPATEALLDYEVFDKERKLRRPEEWSGEEG